MLSRLLIFAFSALIVMTNSVFAQTPTLDAGVSQTLAKWRAANYGDVRYKLNITLEKGAPLMKGDIEVRVNLTDEGAKNDLILDWRQLSLVRPFANSPYAYAYEVNNADNSNIFTLYKNEHLLIPKALLKTGENVVKIKFASPIKTSGAAITRYVDKEDAAEYVYSLFVPSDASTAFPVFDQPDLKARFKLAVNIGGGRKHPGWTVVSDTEPEMAYSSTWNIFYSFKETKPISTYVFAFAAGDFTVFNEHPLDTFAKDVSHPTEQEYLNWRANKGTSIYVRKSQAEKFRQHAAEVFRLNREGVKFLESWFDYKFPFPKYDLVLIPEFPFGGMEHAGATFLREDRVIFPTEPTKNDYITRANVIFHEAAHQWFGDTVTMRWFEDLWLKEGFAEFMAYKTLEKVMPEYNAWKIFYERNKQLAYLTDSTRGTTPIYQEIPNLSAAKSAYGNIVYRKAPSFLRQAEFYLGEDKFQTAVRAFLKKHEFANAEWTDLVKEFETASLKGNPQNGENTNIYEMQSKYSQLSVKEFSNQWIRQKGMPLVRSFPGVYNIWLPNPPKDWETKQIFEAIDFNGDAEDKINKWRQKVRYLGVFDNGKRETADVNFKYNTSSYNGTNVSLEALNFNDKNPIFVFPNYQDYGYGIFLLDEKSRAYVLENIQNEKDDFLRAMMWGSLWDSVREAELAPRDYVALVIKNINVETDESTIQTLLARVSTAMNYYLSDTQSKELTAQLETLLTEKMQNAPTLGQRITFYRAFLNVASTDKAKQTLKDVLNGKFEIKDLKLKTKDKFDIVTKLLILADKDVPNLLAELEKTETSDEAKRYAYAARAGIATAENKQKFFNDFTNNKEISESYIETAFVPFNSTKHADLTLPFLENALKELPNLKRSRKIFFINGWLSAFIGGQKSEQALQIVNKFLAENPNLDRDLRLKVLEVVDGLERAVKIRVKYTG